MYSTLFFFITFSFNDSTYIRHPFTQISPTEFNSFSFHSRSSAPRPQLSRDARMLTSFPPAPVESERGGATAAAAAAHCTHFVCFGNVSFSSPSLCHASFCSFNNGLPVNAQAFNPSLLKSHLKPVQHSIIS